MMKWIWVFVIAFTTAAFGAQPPATGPSKVSMDDDGVAVVNGQRFFPIGIYLYELNSNVMADLHEHRFNTVIGNGFNPDQFDVLRDHGMMAVPFVSADSVAKVKDHPSLLAWYLMDEPEGHGSSPEAMKEGYDKLKATDPNHPIGQCHFLFDAAAKYKASCDFTMIDVYPVTANRDVPLGNVGIHLDEVRRVHANPAGKDWPVWAYIQDFGGKDTDGGKWAQPTGLEVRCMTFIALVHRAQGILYFSYWPKAPQTWAAITEINRDLERVAPWILAKDGKEIAAKSSNAAVQVRARRVGDGWMILAVNTSAKPVEGTISAEGLGDATLSVLRESREKKVIGGKFEEKFGPYESKAYLSGTGDPPVSLEKTNTGGSPVSR